MLALGALFLVAIIADARIDKRDILTVIITDVVAVTVYETVSTYSNGEIISGTSKLIVQENQQRCYLPRVLEPVPVALLVEPARVT